MTHFRRTLRGAPALLLLLLCSGGTAGGQVPPPPPQDEVITVTSDLIQLGVTVLDKDGRFVRGLTRDQFELEVDGRPRPVQFFEAVSARAARVIERQAAGGAPPARRAEVRPTAAPGRFVIFFVDDVHLSHDSTFRTRKLILKFVEEEMQPDDQVLIVTTTSQLGFLQQPTGDKVMLRRAASKLVSRLTDRFERMPPPMTVYEALAVDRSDRDALEYFIGEMLRVGMASRRETAEAAARERARTILAYANRIAGQSFTALEQIARSTARLPGRKLTFFISDGFFLDLISSNASDRLRRIAALSAKNGVVVYSVDARGLSTGQPDASQESRFDKTRRRERINIGELQSSQDVLHIVARDTGGRAFVNSNDLSAAVRKGLDETAEYYVVAWQRGPEDAEANKFRRVKLTIRDRPDLRVLTQSGYLTTAAADGRAGNAGKNAAAVTTAPAESALAEALTSLAGERGLDVELSLSHVNTADAENTLLVNLAVHPAAARRAGGAVEALLAVYDETGKVIERARSEASPPAASPSARFARRLNVAPGLYHVRAAARDKATGEVGTARGWVAVPDVGRGEFSLSGLLVGEVTALAGDAAAAGEVAADGVGLKVGRVFGRTSTLRVVLFVYNAARPRSGPPDISLQLEVRDAAAPGAPAFQSGWKKISVAGVSDLRRLPYAAEIRLDTLAPGRYLLEATAVDNTSQKRAQESFSFGVR